VRVLGTTRQAAFQRFGHPVEPAARLPHALGAAGPVAMIGGHRRAGRGRSDAITASTPQPGTRFRARPNRPVPHTITRVSGPQESRTGPFEKICLGARRRRPVSRGAPAGRR